MSLSFLNSGVESSRCTGPQAQAPQRCLLGSLGCPLPRARSPCEQVPSSACRRCSRQTACWEPWIWKPSPPRQAALLQEQQSQQQKRCSKQEGHSRASASQDAHPRTRASADQAHPQAHPMLTPRTCQHQRKPGGLSALARAHQTRQDPRTGARALAVRAPLRPLRHPGSLSAPRRVQQSGRTAGLPAAPVAVL